jgi:hypothetical protein
MCRDCYRTWAETQWDKEDKLSLDKLCAKIRRGQPKPPPMPLLKTYEGDPGFVVVFHAEDCWIGTEEKPHVTADYIYAGKLCAYWQHALALT